MPGSVALASPATVLPYALCSAFTETTAWPIVASEPYRDGSLQVRLDADFPRRTWALTQRLTQDQWEELVAFRDARKGAQEPFWFYPMQAQYDADGSSTTGRYTVRFNGQLSGSYQVGRWPVGFGLVEIS